jgi:hypothetical protein
MTSNVRRGSQIQKNCPTPLFCAFEHEPQTYCQRSAAPIKLFFRSFDCPCSLCSFSFPCCVRFVFFVRFVRFQSDVTSHPSGGVRLRGPSTLLRCFAWGLAPRAEQTGKGTRGGGERQYRDLSPSPVWSLGTRSVSSASGQDSELRFADKISRKRRRAHQPLAQQCSQGQELKHALAS